MKSWTRGEEYGRQKLLLNLNDVLKDLKVRKRKTIMERLESER